MLGLLIATFIINILTLCGMLLGVWMIYILQQRQIKIIDIMGKTDTDAARLAMEVTGYRASDTGQGIPSYRDEDVMSESERMEFEWVREQELEKEGR